MVTKWGSDSTCKVFADNTDSLTGCIAESALELLKLLHYILEGNHYLVVTGHMLEGQRS